MGNQFMKNNFNNRNVINVQRDILMKISWKDNQPSTLQEK